MEVGVDLSGLSVDEKKTYDSARERVVKAVNSKVPAKYGRVAEILMFLPDFVVLIFRLLKDPRVSPVAKAKLGLFTVYLISPIDIIPDFIPIIGQLDDLVIGVYVVRDVLKSTPMDVVTEHWSGQGDILKTTQMILDVAAEVLDKNVMAAIRRFLNKGSQKKGEKAAAAPETAGAGQKEPK